MFHENVLCVLMLYIIHDKQLSLRQPLSFLPLLFIRTQRSIGHSFIGGIREYEISGVYIYLLTNISQPCFNSYELVPIFYYRDKTRVQMFYFLIHAINFSCYIIMYMFVLSGTLE